MISVIIPESFKENTKKFPHGEYNVLVMETTIIFYNVNPKGIPFWIDRNGNIFGIPESERLK
jgi:hypothetical protein